MDLRGKKITVHDMCLRDGMHPKRHQISLQQMKDIACGLDAAGVPLIEVTHGDGLGGSSVNYGFPAHTDEQYLSAVIPMMKKARVSALLLPGIGTVDHLQMAHELGVNTIRVATHCTEADVSEQHISYARKLGMGIGIRGLFNIQFIVDEKNDVYIIEVNPRSSRTVPFLSKATGYSLADIATLVSLGVTLREQGITGKENEEKEAAIYPPEKSRYYVKAPAFSFSKLHGMDAYLSPEMKSTGEAIGYDKKLHRAMYKAMIASGMRLRSYGTVLVSVADEDKPETIPLIRRFYDMGFNIEATTLTGEYLRRAGIRTRIRRKPSEDSTEILDSIRAGYVSYVINTRAILSGVHYGDGILIRDCAARNNAVMLTSLDTVRMLLDVLEEMTMGISTIDAG